MAVCLLTDNKITHCIAISSCNSKNNQNNLFFGYFLFKKIVYYSLEILEALEVLEGLEGLEAASIL